MIDSIRFAHSYPPLDPERIERFERAARLRLPASYKRFLLLTNGGRPVESNVLIVPGWSFDNTVISFFFGVDTGDTYDLMSNVERYRRRIPSECIPIADDVAGNLLCIDTAPPGEGTILFWDHENEADTPDDRSNVYPVADDVFDLLAKLTRG